ncbi:hypothetical protein A7317_14820 [Pseudomonas fluorescens]|nr:hypothetical protein A7317_14820 [Pseudomonas fluorescens]AOE74138.1 hypothetical protein A7319_15340 [Pseudomonas fluorescens]
MRPAWFNGALEIKIKIKIKIKSESESGSLRIVNTFARLGQGGQSVSDRQSIAVCSFTARPDSWLMVAATVKTGGTQRQDICRSEGT